MQMKNIVKIAVCDDEEGIRHSLIDVLKKILEKEEILYEVYEFSSGVELLESKENIQLLFLDMDMPGIDGIDVGMKIKETNPWCKIVIASGREDRFKETYKVKPLRFVSKPFEEEEIREAILAYVVVTVGTEKLEVFKQRQSFWIRQRDIRYIAAYNGYVEIMANDELYRKDVSLSQLEQNLEKEIFYKVHKSYIVNFFWVTKLEEKEVIVGKIRLPLSRRQRKDIKEAYMQFDVKYR
ncbi:MAG: response regulator transcription factor [Lachnospiraceae bacterium]|nr:response regulator transcription factor [Lachnospiraceae bacterium]